MYPPWSVVMVYAALLFLCVPFGCWGMASPCHGTRPHAGLRDLKTNPPGIYGRKGPGSGLVVTNCIHIGAVVFDKYYERQIEILLIYYSDIEFLVQSGVRIAQPIREQIKNPNTKTV